MYSYDVPITNVTILLFPAFDGTVALLSQMSHHLKNAKYSILKNNDGLYILHSIRKEHVFNFAKENNAGI